MFLCVKSVAPAFNEIPEIDSDNLRSLIKYFFLFVYVKTGYYKKAISNHN